MTTEFMRRYQCMKCQKIMFTKSVTSLRCNKCGYHSKIIFFKHIPREGEEEEKNGRPRSNN